MAYDVIKQAAAKYKGIDPEHFEDEIIVCECARVSLYRLRKDDVLCHVTGDFTFDVDFLMVSTYGKDGAEPELILYKKR